VRLAPPHRLALSCCLLALVLAVVAAVGLGALERRPPERASVPPAEDAPASPTETDAPSSDAIALTPTAVAPYRRAAIGYAISWPQCGQALPQAAGEFGIVGVTNGRPFKANPCLKEEYAWARSGHQYVAFYMNTNYSPSSNPDVIRRIEPVCASRGKACEAYLYGLLAADDAFVAASAVGATAPMWWLDVQIVSSWSDDVQLNALVIHGAIDNLHAHGVRVGISSTPFQWRQVAGDYAPALPGWVAGASNAIEATLFCDGRQDFGLGHTEQIAYVEHAYEMVRACGPDDRATSPRAARELGD
jgi:hypothetical protein